MATRSSDAVIHKRTHARMRRALRAWLHCCTLALPAVALAQQGDRVITEAQARRAGERLQALQHEADQLAAEERTLLGDLRKLEVERELKAEELRQIDAEATQVEVDFAQSSARIEQLQNREQAARPELRARLVEIYKLGRARYLRLLLSTADLRRLGQASRTVAALAELDRDRIVSHQGVLDELDSMRVTLEARRRRLAALRAQTRAAQAAAARAAGAKNDLILDIDRRRDLNAQLSGELQAAQQKLQLTLRDMANGAVAQPSALSIKPFRGDLDWPLAGSIRRRLAPGSAGRASSSGGIEITAAEGTAVHAVHEGAVAFADPFAGFGNLVILDHGAQAFSLYGNLLDIAVKKGARVEAGQPLGSVGTAPAAATSSLYFELRVDGQPVDPLQWLKKR